MPAIIFNALGLLITDFQRGSVLALLAWILIGLVVGYFRQQDTKQDRSPLVSVCSFEHRGRHCRRISGPTAWQS